LDCAEITAWSGDGPGQQAQNFLEQNVDVNRLSFDLMGSRSPPFGEGKFE